MARNDHRRLDILRIRGGDDIVERKEKSREAKMKEIICDCGHSLMRHGGLGCNECKMNWDRCLRSYSTVEARYWARRKYAESLNWEEAWNQAIRLSHSLIDERDALKSELDSLTARWNPMISKLYDEKNDLRTKLDIAICALDYYAKLEMYEVGILHNTAKDTLDKIRG